MSILSKQNLSHFSIGLSVLFGSLALAVPAIAAENNVQDYDAYGWHMSNRADFASSTNQINPAGMMRGWVKTDDRTPFTPAVTGNGQPIIGGNVTAINGSSIIVTTANGVVYTVDATSARVVKSGTTDTTLANIAIGDSIIVQGAVNGTTVIASSVIGHGIIQNSTTQTTKAATLHRGYGFMGAVGGFFSRFFGFF